MALAEVQVYTSLALARLKLFTSTSCARISLSLNFSKSDVYFVMTALAASSAGFTGSFRVPSTTSMTLQYLRRIATSSSSNLPICTLMSIVSIIHLSQAQKLAGTITFQRLYQQSGLF
ncbi:unnamed protein product [Nesidiocoris tenuis]|uniref:Uncharacterized protein n=1 Tax=Nesidiocoris tenuis TaxID=355587 RepID=A0A6H5HLM0_9HEMI|nr:unnamed protein product [Nesidiocoris tenuis]